MAGGGTFRLPERPCRSTQPSPPDSLAATLTGGTFAWSQNGNDVVLNYATAAPEPGTLGLLLVGALGLLNRRRRSD